MPDHVLVQEQSRYSLLSLESHERLDLTQNHAGELPPLQTPKTHLSRKSHKSKSQSSILSREFNPLLQKINFPVPLRLQEGYFDRQISEESYVSDEPLDQIENFEKKLKTAKVVGQTTKILMPSIIKLRRDKSLHEQTGGRGLI